MRERRTGANGYDVTYTYDALGNRLTKLEGGVITTYSYDEADQLNCDYTPTLRTTYSYDANGNTTLVNAGGSLTTYSWDAENRMTLAELPSGARTTATYDGDGKRRGYTDSAGFRGFLWDGENIAHETDATGATVTAYSYAPSTYGALLSERRSGATSFHHGACPERSRGDALGSTIQLTDASQSPTDSYLYRAFGEPTVLSGSSPNPFTWVGQLGYYRQPDTGDYWVRARMYRPAAGRWVSRDPIQAEAHLYRYVGMDPVALVDPTGTKPKECGVCGADVTSALFKTLVYIEKIFDAMPWYQKIIRRKSTISVNNIDIMDLKDDPGNPAGCGEPADTCGRTVSVNGHCYDSSTVNYVQVGLAVALCNRLTRAFTDVVSGLIPASGAEAANPFGPVAARTVIGGYSPIMGSVGGRSVKAGLAYRRGALQWYDVGYRWGTNVGLRDFLLPDLTSRIALQGSGPSFPAGAGPKDRDCPRPCPHPCTQSRFGIRWGGQPYLGVPGGEGR